MTPPIVCSFPRTPRDMELLVAEHGGDFKREWSGDTGVPAVFLLVPGRPGQPRARVAIPLPSTQEGVDAGSFFRAFRDECEDFGIDESGTVEFERRPPDAAASAWRNPPQLRRSAPGPAPAPDFNERPLNPPVRRLFGSDAPPTLNRIDEAPQ
jgi:hypothetical protein